MMVSVDGEAEFRGSAFPRWSLGTRWKLEVGNDGQFIGSFGIRTRRAESLGDFRYIVTVKQVLHSKTKRNDNPVALLAGRPAML
jgi:hypothetical protein